MGREGLTADDLGRPAAAGGGAVVSVADVVTSVRLPLAVAFPLVEDWRWRLAFVLVAGASDVADGLLARRLGSSRIGAVLDPVADKAFMLSAFVTLVGQQAREILAPWELALVLSRDLAAIAAFAATVIVGRRVTVPARLAGKLVTVGQFALLLAILVASPLARPLAWTTGAVAAWSIVDYFHAGRAESLRRHGPGTRGNGTRLRD